MSFLSWLYGKGIAGAISSDLLKKYKEIKSQHPRENEEKILVRVWNLWLTLNADKVLAEDSEDKVVRLNIIKEQNDSKTSSDTFALKSLFGLYQDILYIETEINTSNGKIWNTLMKVFIDESKKCEFDFSEEYESLKRIINITSK